MVPGVSTGPGINRGAQAGIEPATGARVTQHIGSAKAVRNMSTPRHHWMRTLPSPVARIDFGRRQSSPEGRRTRECKCVDIECPGLAEPRVTFSSATMAGSMPAMAPLREGSRCDRPDHSAVSASYENLTALPSR
jgi:hypothetical protein